MDRSLKKILAKLIMAVSALLILIGFSGPSSASSLLPFYGDPAKVLFQNDGTPREVQSGEFLNNDASREIEQPGLFPTDHDRDESQPATSAPESNTAISKLECPAFVTDFIVNATDVKDECEGLTKAFDLTCNGSHKKDRKPPLPAGGIRRRLSEIISPTRTRGDSESSSETFHFLQYTHMKIQELKYRNQFKTQQLEHVENTKRRMLQGVEENYQTEETFQEEEEDDIPLSPSLPTANMEVNDELLNDALTLNTDLSDIKKAIEDINNATTSAHSYSNDQNPNETESEHRQHHQQTEAEELNTAVAVSAVIHSPQVIETQACCRSILKVYHTECNTPESEEYNDKRLVVIVCVIALCGLVKSLIRHFKIRWLPEAGGCILVGVAGGLFLTFLPNLDFGFQHDMFLRLMVPPIVFEAALNIDKRSFREMAIPIVVFAIWGTFMSTILTAAIIYYGTAATSWCSSIPFIESLAFGALISSIDPIAVLSVLSNMGMSDKDQIYVLIFGESLLNDGVAIVLFQTLIHFMDEKIVIDSEACWLATLHFLVIAFGSLFVGVACGVGATVYFWLMKGIQTPLVEVLMFLCWAFIPYYICDGVEWSGIVSIVAAGFFMDIFVIGNRTDQVPTDSNGALMSSEDTNVVPSRKRAGVFSQEGFLSSKAKNHIGFVTEINSTLMETAIFAYLGIFLFNKRYHWNLILPVMAVFACIASRTVMVAFSSFLANTVTTIGVFGKRSMQRTCGVAGVPMDKSKAVIIDGRMQIVLIFAGLRGAMSFALVETVPMFDSSTGEGSRYKPELKAMTSACIMFTVFVLGGYTNFLLERLGLGPAGKDEEKIEMVPLIKSDDEEDPWLGKSNNEEETGPQRRRRPCLNKSTDRTFFS